GLASGVASGGGPGDDRGSVEAPRGWLPSPERARTGSPVVENRRRHSTMKHSTERILTTHCGSLPRPKELLDLMKARAGGEAVDADTYGARVRGAVADIVRQQVQSGVDVVTDGEQSKTSF